MKIAQHLATFIPSFAQAESEKRAIARDQLWEGEGYTKYTFDDNSVLVQSGVSQYGMDADDVDSIRGYAEWLGDDLKFEQAEIDRLLSLIEDDNHGLTRADRAQFYGPSVRI
jgi:hypothetical protein